MAGFRDLLALVLGWKSAGPAAETPYRTAAGRVGHTGAVTGGQHVPGQRAAKVFTPGQAAGQIHG